MDGLQLLGGRAGLSQAEVEALVASGAVSEDDLEELKGEIAPLDTDGTLADDSDTRVPSQKAVKTFVTAEKARAEAAEAAIPIMPQPQLLVPDLLGGSPLVSGTGAVVEKRLTLMRCTVPKSGTLHDLAAYVGVKSGKLILAAYDTGEAKAGFYTRLASKEFEPAESTRWQIAGDPALAVTKGQQIMLGFVGNNATVTVGRGGGGAISASSGQLPASFLAPGGGDLPKLIGQMTAPAFEAPAEIAEASLEAITISPIPYVILARVA